MFYKYEYSFAMRDLFCKCVGVPLNCLYERDMEMIEMIF